MEMEEPYLRNSRILQQNWVLKTNSFSDAEVWCEMPRITGGCECPHSTQRGRAAA
jgi:hypothetical protein